MRGSSYIMVLGSEYMYILGGGGGGTYEVRPFWTLQAWKWTKQSIWRLLLRACMGSQESLASPVAKCISKSVILYPAVLPSKYPSSTARPCGWYEVVLSTTHSKWVDDESWASGWLSSTCAEWVHARYSRFQHPMVCFIRRVHLYTPQVQKFIANVNKYTPSIKIYWELNNIIERNHCLQLGHIVFQQLLDITSYLISMVYHRFISERIQQSRSMQLTGKTPEGSFHDTI